MDFFKLNLLIIAPDKLKQMRAVKVPNVMADGSNVNFHTDGLFSSETFGRQGSPERSKLFAYIHSPTSIFVPNYYEAITNIKSLYGGILAGTIYATFDDNINDFVESTPDVGESGFSFFVKHYKKLNIEEHGADAKRVDIQRVTKYKDRSLFQDLIVLPASYRDYERGGEGEQPSEGEINPLYRKVLSLINIIPPVITADTVYSIDNIRYQLQLAVMDIYYYLESLLSGKRKLVLGKYASRTVQYGTANVITSLINDVSELYGEKTVRAGQSSIGLFQYLKASQPRTIYDLRQTFLSHVFIRATEPVSLVDPKTLKRRPIPIKADTFVKWTSPDGIEKIINRFKINDLRHSPVKVDDSYLWLIYQDATSFMMLDDIDKLPDHLDRKLVRPMTYTEMFYYAVQDTSTKLPGTNTRYPVETEGGVYISTYHLFTTRPDLTLEERDPHGNLTGRRFPHWPVMGQEFVNSMSPHPTHLARLGGDHDGDRADSILTMTTEGKADAYRMLSAREFYVAPDGRLNYSTSTDISDLVVAHMTSPPTGGGRYLG